MSLRNELVALATLPSANISQLSKRFGVSRKTSHKWIKRHREGGPGALEDRSRRPATIRGKTRPGTELLIEAVRLEHPVWGPRKIRAVLKRNGADHVPARSTIGDILSRNGLVTNKPGGNGRALRRFEHPEPNDLWQMDFKGHFPLGTNGSERCHPLTILDDHSRFNITLHAIGNERREPVREQLAACFRRYGLPARILCDNGPPWGCPQGPQYWTDLEVWMMLAGVEMIHGRPMRPQTQGKEERFHRTLDVEVIRRTTVWRDLDHAQREFDQWRECYNLERPHEALGMEVPASRYRISARAWDGQLADPESFYLPGDVIRRVTERGEVNYRSLYWKVGEAFAGRKVALRAFGEKELDIYFCSTKVGRGRLEAPEGCPEGKYRTLTF